MVEKYVQRRANLYSNVGVVLQKSFNPPPEDIEYRSVPSSSSSSFSKFGSPDVALSALSPRFSCDCLSLLGDDMIGGYEDVKEVFIELPEGLDIAANGQ